MGAVTNWDGTIYANLLADYKTTVFKLNLGQAFMILMLGVANLVFTPMSDGMSARLAYMIPG